MSDIVSLPLFGNVDIHVPDLFVLKMKKSYKLISPPTKTGEITSRHGKKHLK